MNVYKNPTCLSRWSVSVPYTGDEFKCDNPEQAILNYGHEAVKNWFVIDNIIHINLEE